MRRNLLFAAPFFEVNRCHALFRKRVPGFREPGARRLCARLNAPADARGFYLQVSLQQQGGSQRSDLFGGLFKYAGQGAVADHEVDGGRRLGSGCAGALMQG